METKNTETATLGAGCFWCVEAVFDDLRGVESVESGYSGGHTENPTYQQVCSEMTGHAEVVNVNFNPQEISFKEILQVFFAVHDPTTLNRQGNDIGSSYRSAIFYHDANQKRIAEETIKEVEAEGVYDSPLVTEVKRSINFTSLKITTRNISPTIQISRIARRLSRRKWQNFAKNSWTD
jgi:peptide-methionine (S)-S-oxide reductase